MLPHYPNFNASCPIVLLCKLHHMQTCIILSNKRLVVETGTSINSLKQENANQNNISIQLYIYFKTLKNKGRSLLNYNPPLILSF